MLPLRLVMLLFDMLPVLRFMFEDMFEFDIDEFDMVVLPVDMFDEFDIVVFDIDEFMFDIDELVMLVFERFALVALLAPLSPQAIPRAPSARTDESAITFFILTSILLSSSKIDLTYLKKHRTPSEGVRYVPTGWLFGTSANIRSGLGQVNPNFRDFCTF